jgi:hypothetical protein
MSLLGQMAVVQTTAASTTYKNNQLQAARQVNQIEYQQRVEGLKLEMAQLQVQRERSTLEAQQAQQQNQRSYTQGMYEVMKQRVTAQEQAYAGKEQGMQIQGDTAAQATAQYRDLINAALQLEAQQQQAQNKDAEAQMFTSPFSVTNLANTGSNLQAQLSQFVQNSLLNNQAIGDAEMQTQYADVMAAILQKLGINDSLLTSSMADTNQAGITSQYNQNANNIARQQQLNNNTLQTAQNALNNAATREQQRYQSDDRNLVRLAQAQQSSAPSSSGAVGAGGAIYANNKIGGLTLPNLRLSGVSYQEGMSYDQMPRTQLSASYGQQQTYTSPSSSSTTTQQGAPNRLYIGGGSTAKEELLKMNPNNVIIMPEDVKKK